MRAFVLTAPGRGAVRDVPEPVAGPGEVVVAVHRVGLCGTDAEFFAGTMAYLHTGEAAYPLRPGHEWCGTVAAVGPGVDPAWAGRRVTGDTMLGCGRCARCTAGRGHLCAGREEIGIRGGRAGALAERLAVPASALVALPDAVDDTLGALVEPGGNALRAARAAAPAPGAPLLVAGPGTIGLLTAMFARAAGARVHLLTADGDAAALPRALGFADVWTAGTLPAEPFAAVVDATDAAALPALAVDLVEPGGRVVLIGLAGSPSTVDARRVTLRDLTVVGVLSASGALAGTVDAYAAGAVDPRPLVAATVGLGEVAAVLAGGRPAGARDAPKVLVDPRR